MLVVVPRLVPVLMPAMPVVVRVVPGVVLPVNAVVVAVAVVAMRVAVEVLVAEVVSRPFPRALSLAARTARLGHTVRWTLLTYQSRPAVPPIAWLSCFKKQFQHRIRGARGLSFDHSI